MSAIRIALLGSLVLAIGVASAREEKAKIDKAKLIGTWTYVKTTSAKAPPEGAEMKVEFTKDGKLNVSMKLEDKSRKLSGTYKVDGDQLTSVLKGPSGKDKKETVTISELTAKKLVTTEDEDGKKVTTEFKK
jgi:uncharacterized protein (TIGR03066 family)